MACRPRHAPIASLIVVNDPPPTALRTAARVGRSPASTSASAAAQIASCDAEQEAGQILLAEKDEAILELTQESNRWREEAGMMREKAALLEGKVAGLEQALGQINVRMIPVMGTTGD